MKHILVNVSTDKDKILVYCNIDGSVKITVKEVEIEISPDEVECIINVINEIKIKNG